MFFCFVFFQIAHNSKEDNSKNERFFLGVGFSDEFVVTGSGCYFSTV